MTERPNPWRVLADELLAAGVDRLTAANIVATTADAVEAAKRFDDMEAWRARVRDAVELPDGVDLDAWRRVCLAAYENLPSDTAVRMADVDRVLVLGARRADRMETAEESGAAAYDALVREIAGKAEIGVDDVDAVLVQCGSDAADLLNA